MNEVTLNGPLSSAAEVVSMGRWNGISGGRGTSRQ